MYDTGEVGFVADDSTEDWVAPKDSLTIKSPWYSLGASVKIAEGNDKPRIYMFHPARNAGTVGNAVDAATGRSAGKRFKAALKR